MMAFDCSMALVRGLQQNGGELDLLRSLSSYVAVHAFAHTWSVQVGIYFDLRVREVLLSR